MKGLIEKLKRPRMIQWGIVFVLMMLALPRVGMAQPIAMILTEQAAAYKTVGDMLKEQLGGMVKTYDMKDSRSHDQKIIGDINAQKPRLILALGDKAATLASEKLTAYPVLIGMVLELDQDLFQAPRVQGVGLQIPPESVLTQLRLVYPNLKRIGVLSGQTRFESLRKSINQSANSMGIQVVEILGKDKQDLQRKLDEKIGGLDAVWLLPDPSIVDTQTFHSIVQKTKKAKKAFVVFSENFVKAGALFSVSPDYTATGQQLALLSKKILEKGPVKPEKAYLGKFHYPIGSYSVLNLNTAKSIGLSLSPEQLNFINQIVNGKHW